MQTNAHAGTTIDEVAVFAWMRHQTTGSYIESISAARTLATKHGLATKSRKNFRHFIVAN